ncbi:MAG: hypothetical protein ACREBG_29550 [Pyrinomonadaceae bacterium]
MTQNGQVGAGSTSERNLTVKIEVTEKPADKDHEAGSGARDVRLFRNGSLVKVWRGDVLKGQTATTLEANIAIVAGDNRLAAYAFNRPAIWASVFPSSKGTNAFQTWSGALHRRRESFTDANQKDGH